MSVRFCFERDSMGAYSPWIGSRIIRNIVRGTDRSASRRGLKSWPTST